MIVQNLLMGVVRGYRLLLSPWLGYALQALQLHGAAKGSYLTVHRLVRCGPWCQGGHDPVPAQAPRLFTALFSPTSSKKTP